MLSLRWYWSFLAKLNTRGQACSLSSSPCMQVARRVRAAEQCMWGLGRGAMATLAGVNAKGQRWMIHLTFWCRGTKYRRYLSRPSNKTHNPVCFAEKTSRNIVSADLLWEKNTIPAEKNKLKCTDYKRNKQGHNRDDTVQKIRDRTIPSLIISKRNTLKKTGSRHKVLCLFFLSHTSGNARATLTCLYRDLSCIAMTEFLY